VELIYDGDCGFCTSSARWVERRAAAHLEIVPWHSVDLDERGLSVDDVTTAAWVVDGDERYRGHEAIAMALRQCGAAWPAIGWLLMAPPMSWFARHGYTVVAANRHRLPGSTDACRLEP
jgi:predicted DCC family thiol-disulfide oxidoreductase YuxK